MSRIIIIVTNFVVGDVAIGIDHSLRAATLSEVCHTTHISRVIYAHTRENRKEIEHA